MRWPWVSRSTYEAALSLLDRQQDRIDSLLETVLSMKREGYAPPPPEPELEPIEPEPLAPEIENAITRRSAPASALRRQLQKYADERLAAPDQPDAEEVANEILTGADLD